MKRGFFEGPRLRHICNDCKRDVTTVRGPYYPADKGVLCSDCGEKNEAKHFNKIVCSKHGRS